VNLLDRNAIDKEKHMTDQKAKLAAMLARGNEGATTTKGRDVYPPAGVYRVTPQNIVVPDDPNVNVINVHFLIDEVIDGNAGTKGRNLSAAFWCNNPDAVQRSADQVSYALTGRPANAKMTMGDVAQHLITLSETKEFIVDRTVVQGNTAQFPRDRFYTPDRWAKKQPQAAFKTISDVNGTSGQDVEEAQEALAGS
jgi:hypothetical protein